MVLDGVEKHLMRLCPESLALSVGSQRKFDCLEDVRVLRGKPSRSGVKKSTRRNTKGVRSGKPRTVDLPSS